MATAAVMMPVTHHALDHGVSPLPRVPMPLPDLPQVGATVRVTTTMGGLPLQGTLQSVNLFQGTLTICTRRFKQPLCIQAGNVRFLTQLAPAPESQATREHAEAQQGQEAAAGLAHLVAAVKATSLSPLLGPSAAPAMLTPSQLPDVAQPVSPALSAASGSSLSAASTLRVSSRAFVPASAARRTASPPMAPAVATSSIPTAIPVATVVATTVPRAVTPPQMYRAVSMQSFSGHMVHTNVAAMPVSLPPAVLPPTTTVPRSTSFGSGLRQPSVMGATTVGMAVPPMAVPRHNSPARMQQPMPQPHLARPRSVSPAHSTGSASSGGASALSLRSAHLNELCKYFSTPKGCSRGAACRYRHVNAEGETVIIHTKKPVASVMGGNNGVVGVKTTSSRRSRRRGRRAARNGGMNF